MTEQKQIEEMAKELTAYEKKLCERLPKDKCLLTSAVHAQVSCDYCKIAEFLVNAGYRKQGENTDEVRHGHWLRYGYDGLQCSLCGAVNNNYINNNYCPNCGARMTKGDEGGMKLTRYTFNFKGGKITVRALNEEQARILAQAEAINRCWDYEIIDHPTEKEKGGETDA